jgi:hypothetical protein
MAKAGAVSSRNRAAVRQTAVERRGLIVSSPPKGTDTAFWALASPIPLPADARFAPSSALTKR